MNIFNNSPALAELAEALIRVEYKLDLLLKKQLQAEEKPPPIMDPSFSCPACRSSTKYIINFMKGGVATRICGCGTHLQPLTTSFEPPNIGAKDGTKKNRDDTDSD